MDSSLRWIEVRRTCAVPPVHEDGYVGNIHGRGEMKRDHEACNVDLAPRAVATTSLVPASGVAHVSDSSMRSSLAMLRKSTYMPSAPHVELFASLSAATSGPDPRADRRSHAIRPPGSMTAIGIAAAEALCRTCRDEVFSSVTINCAVPAFQTTTYRRSPAATLKLESSGTLKLQVLGLPAVPLCCHRR